MALITCKKCGGQISDKARKCPHCGYVLRAAKGEDISLGYNDNEQLLGQIQQDDNTTVNRKKRNNSVLIGLGVVVILLVSIISIMLNSHPLKKSEKSQAVNTSSNSTKDSDDYIYDKTILYDSDYATLELGAITNQGIEISITSKLKNRDISAILNASALDGKVVAYSSPYSFKIQPGRTETYLMEGTIDTIEHKYISLCGELYDDTGTGFEKIDICDFEIGGNENREKYENEKIDISTNDVDVVNQGIGGTGIQLQVTNNNTHFIWLACEQLEVDDKSYDYSNMYLEHAYIPGRSTGIIYVNILGKNPDLVVSDIKEYNGVFKVIDNNGYTIGSFEISSKT